MARLLSELVVTEVDGGAELRVFEFEPPSGLTLLWSYRLSSTSPQPLLSLAWELSLRAYERETKLTQLMGDLLHHRDK